MSSGKMWKNFNLLCSLCVIELLCFSKCNGDLFIQPFSFPPDVIRGQSVTVTCSVSSGTGSFIFKWYKDGISLTDQPMVRIQTAEEYSLLYLKTVDGSRSGNYTCQVDSDAITSNRTAELFVFELPEWDILPVDSEAVHGSSLRIDCSAIGKPPPKISWSKVQDSPVTLTPIVATGGRHQILPNGTLLFNEVRMEDEGEYECTVSNGLGDGLKKIVTVIVHVPPLFHENQNLQKAKSSHSTVLRCDVTGDLPITIKWAKESMDNADSRYKIQETPLPNGLLSELYITRVLKRDAGVYICSASNIYGRMEKSIKLLVLEPPASPTAISIKHVEKTEATIQWKVPYAGNSPIIKYILQYWKDTGSTPKLEEISIGADKISYVLKNLASGTSFVVRLIAENEFGVSTPSVPIRFYTAEDTPSGYPTDLSVYSSGSEELIIRWKAPALDQRNGVIQGYELGYREHTSLEPYFYRDTSLGTGLVQEFVLDKLKENTEYEVVVRAFNRAGKGPTSMPVLGKTKEKGALMAPLVWTESVSATSVFLKWSGNEDIKSPDLRHLLQFRAEGKRWQQRSIPSVNPDSYMLTDLEENTLYHIYLQAVLGSEKSNPSMTVTVRTSDPSFERSSMSQVQDTGNYATLVICLSVVTSCVLIVCVIAGACVYVTRVTSRNPFKRDVVHALSDYGERPPTRSHSPLSRHPSSFRYVDVNSRPLLWCSTPAPPNDYPSPYATLPLRPTPISKRWQSEDGMLPGGSERSESLLSQRADIPEDKISIKE